MLSQLDTKKLIHTLTDAKEYIIEHCSVPGENAVVLSNIEDALELLRSF